MSTYSWSAKVISICWLLFAIIWILAAFSTKRTIQHESPASRLGYLVLIVFGYLLIANSRFLPIPLSLRIIPRAEWFAILAACMCVAGLAFAVWARFTLGRNWSGLVTLKADHELIQRGPYRIVRHPIYTGVLMMVFATFLLRGGAVGVPAVFLILLGFWFKMRAEENLMLQRFPREYGAYQQRVKRLIPFLI